MAALSVRHSERPAAVESYPHGTRHPLHDHGCICGVLPYRRKADNMGLRDIKLAPRSIRNSAVEVENFPRTPRSNGSCLHGPHRVRAIGRHVARSLRLAAIGLMSRIGRVASSGNPLAKLATASAVTSSRSA